MWTKKVRVGTQDYSLPIRASTFTRFIETAVYSTGTLAALCFVWATVAIPLGKSNGSSYLLGIPGFLIGLVLCILLAGLTTKLWANKVQCYADDESDAVAEVLRLNPVAAKQPKATPPAAKPPAQQPPKRKPPGSGELR